MKTQNVTTTAAEVIAPGNYPFIHIQNVSDTTIYVKYDGDAAEVTTANGLAITANETLMLNNDGAKPIFTHGVRAIHGGSGNKEIRVQGAS